MSWATNYISNLHAGKTVRFRPRGNSMTPIIKSGQLCTVAPVGSHVISKGDVVLCKVKGQQYLHIVSAVRDDQYQISNNQDHINGWTKRQNIFGILVSVAP